VWPQLLGPSFARSTPNRQLSRIAVTRAIEFERLHPFRFVRHLPEARTDAVKPRMESRRTILNGWSRSPVEVKFTVGTNAVIEPP